MSNAEPILAEFLTREELAVELRVNKRTLDRWEALGIGPPRTLVGRQILYRRSSLLKWLAAQERSSTVEKEHA
jgi:DNA-binding transcriptional MerR regulator